MVNIKKAFNKLTASPQNFHRDVPAQRTDQRNIALAILESQIEAEKVRTEEAKAEQARIQSLAASAERRTSVRKDKSTNEMPRSPYQTTTKEKKIPSNNSSDGFNAFRCPPIQTQTREIQTIDTQKQSTLTQTNDDFSSQNDSSNSYSFTENKSEKKRGSVKFPPRFQPPFDIYDNHDTPKSSIITTSSLTIEKKSYETETNMYEKFDLIKKEQQKEAEERRKKEEKQFEELKKLIQSNPVEATKMPKLSASSSFHPYALSTSTKVQGKSNSVFAEKTNETRRDSQAINSKQGNIQQDSVSNQPIKLVENQMLGTIDVIIENTNDSKNIAVIGLPKTGRSTLVGALAGGIWPKNLFQNPVNTKYGKIYKLNYPNNGFIDGSVNENRPIYEKFFQNAKLSNLSTLIITIDGSVREEDYLVLSLAQKYCIPTVIARTKLDEWLDNRPKDQSKEDYVKDDKKFVIESLQKLGINFSQNNIFNISALSTIIIAEEGSQSDMFKYLQDDDALLETLNKLIASPRNSHRNVPAQRTEQSNIALAILESQIEAEKLRTEEAKAEQARIQSLAASAERRTSVRKDKSTNEMPRSPYQTTTKEKKIPSNNSSDGFNAFRCPPIQTQTREIQTIDTQKQSTLTQTNDDFSSQNDSSNSYSSTENISEKKRGSVKFPPRFQPPFDIYDNHDTPKSSIITTPSLTIEKKSYETETNMYEKFDLIKKEQQKEAEERRKKEEKQFEELKKLIQSNPVEATKMPKLSASSSFHPYALSTSTKVQGKSNSVFAEKTSETQRDSQAINSKQGNIQQDSVSNQPIKLVENQMLGTIDVIIENTNDSKNIAVIGLPKTGRSTLVGALAGGIWPKNLSQNPVNTKYGKIYKLNYPNNGFIDGSVNENRPIYEEFFQNAKLSNLSTLIITIDGSVREEDYLVLSLAQKYCIPTVIARTKLDEWLDNRPKDQSKEDYVKDDKKFVIESLQKLGINFSQNNIFNISALSTIIIAEEGSQSDMFKYLQDEQSLLSMLHFEYNKNVVLLNEKQQQDVVFLGLSGAGKSTIMDGLLNLHLLQNDKMKEINYDETMPTEDVLKKLENIRAKIYLIVVANTVCKIDANLAENFVKTGKNFAVLLSKSDEIIGNLKKQQTFVCMEDYVHDRHEAANIEFQKLDFTNIPKFAISGYKLTGFVEDSAEEESFLNFLKQFL